jgi:hypothetical protein
MARREVQVVDPARDEAILLAAGAGLLSAAAGIGWAALQLATRLQGQAAPPAAPAPLIRALAAHRVRWDTTTTLLALLLAALLSTAILAAVLTVNRTRTAGLRGDSAARHLASITDLRHLREPARRATATRLGLPTELAAAHPGLPVGDVLLPPAGKRRAAMYASWEDMTVLVAGPRTNKTTAYAIPVLLAAPGAALATSNKRDVLDATRKLRAKHGRVWVFDPQRVADESPAWWWDPIGFLTGRDGAPDPARAGVLAAQLVTSATPAGARTDAYFDTEKTTLLSLLLLAAACDSRPISTVWTWICDPGDTAPADALTRAGHGEHARALSALASLPDKQRDGVYGSARAVVGFLLDPALTAWITPNTDRPAFSPKAFAGSKDTLYLLSRDGTGGAAPLVAALTLAVTDALEAHATASPAGRLPVPFVGVLDEAANICRLRDLDSLYSHYGSRGICLVTVLQSWAQGASAWGQHGMEKLWSAANIRIYGGGVDDHVFLRRLSELIGTHQRLARSRSSGRNRHLTHSVIERTTLSVAELRELPAGRAICFASGTPAFLLQPRPWWTGPHAQAIQAALDDRRQAGIAHPRITTPAEELGHPAVRQHGPW